MTHTVECSIAKASRDLQIAAYRMMWPKRCETCKGAGGFAESYDPSPSGVALGPGSMMMFDPCCICVEKNVCPRCAVNYGFGIMGDLFADNGFCIYCGWREDANGTHEPPPYECGCWWELEREFEMEMLRRSPAEFNKLFQAEWETPTAEDPGELGEGQFKYWEEPW